MSERTVTSVLRAQQTSDGAGVKLRRSIGTPALRHLDPFLMLDAFGTDNPDDYIAGFPNHPHRGFETVTYMLAGRMQHKDSVGNTGDLVAGSVQWMTAGRGIIHSEIPQQTEGRMAGFQLWVNLPAARKMTAPRYQDIPPERIPTLTTPAGVTVKVIAGQHHHLLGPVATIDTHPVLLDVQLPAGTSHAVALPAEHTAFAYVFEGSVALPGGPDPLPEHHLAVLSLGDHLTLTAGPQGGRALVVAGRPLREPIVQYGPFVMNTPQEIQQAFADYQAGRLAT